MIVDNMGNKKWNNNDIPDLTEKTIIITGANSGIGLEVTKAFAAKNALVIMACRNLEKAKDAESLIREEYPKASLKLIKLDLADLSSIKNFVNEFKRQFSTLDILCNNAGLMMTPYDKTKDNFELQFGTNHLGHYALTGQLLDVLKNSKEARVITMSSMVHRFGKINSNDINWEERKDKKLGAYGQSKLANLIFAYDLQRKFEKNNIKNIKSIGAHPGWSATKLQRYSWYLRIGNKFLGQNAKMGALTMLYGAIANDIEGGEYIGPRKLFAMRGHPKKVKSSKLSKKEDVAEDLWKISEELTGISYNF